MFQVHIKKKGNLVHLLFEGDLTFDNNRNTDTVLLKPGMANSRIVLDFSGIVGFDHDGLSNMVNLFYLANYMNSTAYMVGLNDQMANYFHRIGVFAIMKSLNENHLEDRNIGMEN